MKKLAFISGLLFFIVYLGVNTLTSEKNSFNVIYPSVPVSSLETSENPSDPTTQKPASSQSDSSPAKYNYLIVASFRDLEQANKVASDYSDKYQSEMFVLPSASNGSYRISYGKYNTTTEAIAALEALKLTDFPDAWLLQSK